MGPQPERTYALQRAGQGRYIALSNDGTTVYLVQAFDEDGSAVRIDARGNERPVRGRFWGVSRLKADHDQDGRPLVQRDARGVVVTLEADIADRGTWTELGWGSRSRREALASID